MNIFDAKTVLTRTFSRTILVAGKHAPEIFFGLGIASGVVAGIFVHKAALKVDGIKCDTQAKFLKIANGRYAAEHGELAEGETYTEEDAVRDTVIAYTQGAFALARLYAPVIGLGLLSIGLLTQSHRILNKRNAILLGAYKALDLTFEEYKTRIENEFGVDPIVMDEEVVGEKTIVENTTDAQGNQQTDVKKVPVVNRKVISPYAIVFDEHSHRWAKSHIYNDFFLKTQEAYFNESLRLKGHLFLNEVYDGLGVDRTQAGCIVGWVYGVKDSFVDIGWSHPRNQNNDMVNPNPPYVLDFNVDGVIYDHIA